MMRSQRIDPRRLIFNTTPTRCKTCENIIHAWFPTKEEFDKGVTCMDCDKRTKHELTNNTKTESAGEDTGTPSDNGETVREEGGES